jgi:class 3 adenylate cyclase/predicted ATPase
MRCAHCGADSRENAKFCDGCGAQLALKCPSCGTVNRSSAKFCDSCGTALATTSSLAVAATRATDVRLTAEEAVAEEIEGERKVVTALFADLTGSTALLETLDPEEGRAIVEPLIRIMSDAVRRYEGYLVRTTGDGIFALFGAPIAYEDHPQRALSAASLMQQELHAYRQEQDAKGNPVLDARVGVHTGEVVAYAGEASGKVEYRLVGHTANLASRMESIAPPGSIAVSETTAKLCDGYFKLRSLGPTIVKGVGAPVTVYEVMGPGPLRSHFELSAQRGLTRFVGRQSELDQMRRALERSRAGQGQIVAVVAEAGAGKSRLLYEFKAAIPGACKVLEAYSVSHGKASAWLPVLELLRGCFGITETDDAASRRDKIRTTLGALDPVLDDTLPYLFGLLGIVDGPDPRAQMDPHVKRQRTLDALNRLILRDSLRQPMVVIFEDLHWIDEQTQGLLDLLADSIGSARILLLFNYRPEYHHGWANKSYYSQVRLEPLTRGEGAAMLSALLGEGDELGALKGLIAERTGGNPFFIEEMVHALFDDGALVRNGSVKVTRALAQLRLPATVQGMLASRIDRLPVEHKQLLQTLAVMGKESRLALIRNVVSIQSLELENKLADLRSGEFIYEQSAASDLEYVFKHALTHEVAYNSLLIERRKVLHEYTGQALEAMYAATLEDHLTELAHHYSLGSNASKAIYYLERASQKAIQRSANANALNSLTLALSLLPKMPDQAERQRQELDLQLTIGSALIPTKGWAAPEVEGVYRRVRELCEQLGDRPELFFALFGLWAAYFIRGAFQSAKELAVQLLQRAQDGSNPMLLVFAHFALGDTSFNMGNFLRARNHLEAVCSLHYPERDGPLLQFGVDPKINCLGYAGMTLWFLGYPDQALRWGKEGLALGQTLSHPNSLASIQNFLGTIYQRRREVACIQEQAEQGTTLSTEHGLGLWLPLAKIQRGWAQAAKGSVEEGIAEMREGLADYQKTGAGIGLTYHFCSLAEAYMWAGDFDEAAKILEEALNTANKTYERHYDAEIYRLKGELLMQRDPPNPAEALTNFQRAVAIARNQSAKSWELRGATSLARLLASQGRRNEAVAMLAEIYNWFTEGFDTADLKEAKGLLDELAA